MYKIVNIKQNIRELQFKIEIVIPIRLVKCGFAAAEIFIYFFLLYSIIFFGFIEKVQGEISSFLMGMAFAHPFV